MEWRRRRTRRSVFVNDFDSSNTSDITECSCIVVLHSLMPSTTIAWLHLDKIPGGWLGGGMAHACLNA